MKAVAILLLAVNLTSLTRDTNSHAANRRGLTQFEKKQYDAAAQSFAKANELRPSTDAAFNRGTAEIAAGKRAQGSATLTPAVTDPKLRADALYNRGNSALQSGAFEHAIRDYVDVLKLRPNDAQAKRNLEIALEKNRRQQQQNAGAGGQQKSASPQKPEQQPQQQAPGAQRQQQPQPGGGTDAEALLRSVQQQEQEERRRMKAAGRDRERVGW